MGPKLQKHLEERGIDPASPLGKFLQTVQEVKKTTAERLMAEAASVANVERRMGNE